MYPLASAVCRPLIPEVSCEPSQSSENIHVHIPATTSFLSTCMSRITNIFTISMSILTTGTVWKPNFDLICNTIKLLPTNGQNKDILKEKKNVLLVFALYNLPFYTDFLWLALLLLIVTQCTVKPFLRMQKCQCSNKSLMLFVFLEFLA